MFEATWESVRTHQVPQWFHDAKLGVFLHWGLYSVPGWAPQVPDIGDLMVSGGPRRVLRDNPYAEWYGNTMQIEGSPTQLHHRRTYGDAPYDDFVAAFDDASTRADLDALAEVCRSAGAGYVVLTTKHHDGFSLWPSGTPHPTKGAYQARRDLVGDLTAAVRARGMHMGLYYSGGYDWPFNGAVLKRAADAILAVPSSPQYLDYATAHLRELIDRYHPSILWNDIGWPAGGNLAELFAYYYNTVEDGVINDRWLESTLPRNAVSDAVIGFAGDVLQALWRFLPERRRRQILFAGAKHYDFRTPEYSQFDHVPHKKWESTRGVGHSFGANRNERPEDILSPQELIWLLCDVVSKNGNLLIGVGPTPEGAIPELQLAPLRGLGTWMAGHGGVVRASRPWDLIAPTGPDAHRVRYLQNGGRVFALMKLAADARTFRLDNVEHGSPGPPVVGLPAPVRCDLDPSSGTLTLPDRLPDHQVYVVDLGDSARPRAGAALPGSSRGAGPAL